MKPIRTALAFWRAFEAVIVVSIFSVPCQAQDGTWLAPSSGLFHDPAKWLNGVVPGPNGAAYFTFDQGSPYTVNLGKDAAGGVTAVDGPAVTLDLNGFAYTMSSFLAVGTDARQGMLKIVDGAATCGILSAGTGLPSATGSLLLDGQAALLMVVGDDDAVFGGGTSNQGSMSLTNGAAASFNHNLMFGRGGGDGSLLLSGGSAVTVENGAFFIGFGEGNTATSGAASVSGDSHVEARTGSVLVGLASGTGSLDVLSGGSVSAGTHLDVGDGQDSIGTAQISGSGSSMHSGGALNVGSGGGGDGTVTVSDGATVSSVNETMVGQNTANKGTVNVSGSGSSWNVGTFMHVGGNDGQGEFLVSGGAQLNVGDSLRIGYGGAACQGHVEAAGEGSSLTVGNELRVGEYGGHGELVISDGAVVEAKVAGVGLETGSVGSLVVSGPGSSIGALVAVGGTGSATLLAEDGASISSQLNNGDLALVVIGVGDGAYGEVVLRSPGTHWDGIGPLYVTGIYHSPTHGEGHLTIEDGARLDCTSLLAASDQGDNHAFVTVRGQSSLLACTGSIRNGEIGSQAELSLLEQGGITCNGLTLGIASTLRVGIGAGPGHIQSSGPVKIDGALEVVKESNLKPGDSFTIINGSSIAGTFDSVSPADFTVQYNAKSVSVVYKACYGDIDGSGTFDLFDFLTFTNLFNAHDSDADCNADGSFDLFDFLCFVNFFNAGC